MGAGTVRRHSSAQELWTIPILAIVTATTLAGRAMAEERMCSGPPQCCPSELAAHPPVQQTVRVGVAIIGLYNVSDKASSWDADLYLYEAWKPLPGFVPRTEIVNEVSRGSEQFDHTEIRGDHCVRSRRLRSTLSSPMNLRLFPFDRQKLTIELSDAEYTSDDVRYAEQPYLLGIDDAAHRQLSAWKIEEDPSFARRSEAFRWEEGSPSYDHATIGVRVRRHITFHLLRFFLPLFIIVGVAFTVFWIDPEDLNSQSGIGVTCLLAAIAFQFAEGSNLPEVAYTTLADRVYVCCYVLIALALVESVIVNRAFRDSRSGLALKFDRICRFVFPIALLVGVGASFLLSYLERRTV